MAVRNQHSYNHHYSDWIQDSGIPIGTIMCIFVDAATTTTSTTNDAADNYPGWLYCNGQSVNVEDYPFLYEILGDEYGGTPPSSVTLSDWGNPLGSTATATFNVPDMRMKRVNGPDGINGPGSLTPSNLQMQVGDTGGQWYISRNRQSQEYNLGTVRVSGYENCIDFVDGSLSGTADLKIGPLQSRVLNGAPAHSHILFTSESDQRNGGDNGDPWDGERTPNYVTNYAAVDTYDSENGFPAEHTHYLAEFSPVNTGSNAQYSWDLAEQYTLAESLGSGTPNAYTNAYGAGKVNDNATNQQGQQVTMLIDKQLNVTPAQAGITLNSGTITMTAGEQIDVVASVIPTNPIGTVLKYFTVKYLIKAW